MSGSYYVDSSNRGNVNELLDQAELYRDQALQYSNASAASATDADSSEANALSSATNAAASASAASTSQANAASSASAAASSAANASAFSSSASSFATDAGVARDAAVVAKDGAQTAATNAAASATAAANSATQATNVLSTSLLKANNLSDLVNATTARSNLGLGTAATQTVTTSNTDTTVGRVLKVGDFGVGRTNFNVDMNLNNISTTGLVGVEGLEADAVGFNWPTTGFPSGTPVCYSVQTIVNTGNNRLSQVATQCYNTLPGVRQWIRTKHDADWTNWVEVMTSRNVTTSSTDSTAGRLLKVGDFGVATDAVIVTDANLITTSGFYRLDAGSGINGPLPGSYFSILSYRYFSTAGAQIATRLGDTLGRTWVRGQEAGIWGAWREVSVGVDSKSACTAWVNFNGTGTVAIRDSFNVSSITDNGVGKYTVNFATSMNNANYSAVATNSISASANPFISGCHTYATGSVRVEVQSGAGALTDALNISVQVFGGK